MKWLYLIAIILAALWLGRFWLALLIAQTLRRYVRSAEPSRLRRTVHKLLRYAQR